MATTSPTLNYASDEHNRWIGGYRVQRSWKMDQAVSLGAVQSEADQTASTACWGLRYDRSDEFRSIFNPRLGLIRRFTIICTAPPESGGCPWPWSGGYGLGRQSGSNDITLYAAATAPNPPGFIPPYHPQPGRQLLLSLAYRFD